jgi:predicted signal transduction protein with EAL and GGDEF domain
VHLRTTVLRSTAEALKSTLVSDGKRLEITHFCLAACGTSIREGVFAGPKSLDAPEPAIDDFGTGYSSLRYLAHLPIDVLKIDRSFVTAMTNNADDMAIVSSIISLAHGLDLNVVAEGVETEEQHKLLQLLRCDQMQGYLFSRPIAKGALEEMLRREQVETAAEGVARLREPAISEFAERRLIGRTPARRN